MGKFLRFAHARPHLRALMTQKSCAVEMRNAILRNHLNCDLKFIHVSFGYPGSIHDARVLRLRGLFDLGENEQILTSPMKIVSGTEIPPLIIGDSAYPLLKWLVRQYSNRGHLPPDEREFNKKLSAARSVVERAFGMLKGRWCLLLKKVEQQTRTLSKTVLAACILHNICIYHGDLYDCSDSDSDDSDSEDDYAGPLREGGTEIREALKNFVWDNL